MSRTLARFLLATSSIVAFTLLLTPAGPLGARGRGPSSLQPDSSATIITMVLQRDEPVSHGKFLILPSPNSNASPYAKGGNSGGGSTGGGGGKKGGGGGSTGGSGGSTGGSTVPCCGGPLTLNSGTSSGLTAYNLSSTAVETPTTTQPEAEEEVAVDPNSSGNIVEAISDFANGGYNNTKWALSVNGGGTWFENFVPTDPISSQLVTSDGATWSANSDPVVAFDKSGNVYLSDLYIQLDSSGKITAEGLYVSAYPFSQLNSTGGFATYNTDGTIANPHTYPIWTNLNTNGSSFNIEDKPWITVDNSATSPNKGTVYASWSHFTGCQNQYNALVGGYVLTCSSDFIEMSYSTNQGVSWSQPMRISPSTQDGAVQGSQPAVGPDGTVYVTYELMGSNNQRQQQLAVGTWSTGSLSFSTPFPASPVFYELGFAGCNTCSASYRVNSFPNIAVGPKTTDNPGGNVYLVYGAQATSTSLAQVNIMACTANCTSASTSNPFYGPGIISEDDSQEAFFPAVAVASDGVIHTSWLDTRNSGTIPTNPDYLDVYASYLVQANATAFNISPNARVTPTTDNASVLAGWGDTGFIGDYIGIAATPPTTTGTPGTAYPVWTNAAGALGYLTQGLLQTRPLPLPSSP